MTTKEALEKIKKFCAYQDRCQSEVRTKLQNIGAPPEIREELISILIEEKFLDEERFSKSFARGKFYYKSWGRKKIVQELKKRSISDYCIRTGLKEINEDDYQACLEKLSNKKSKELGGVQTYEDRGKLQRYLYNKGFEQELIWKNIERLDKSE